MRNLIYIYIYIYICYDNFVKFCKKLIIFNTFQNTYLHMYLSVKSRILVLDDRNM